MRDLFVHDSPICTAIPLGCVHDSPQGGTYGRRAAEPTNFQRNEKILIVKKFYSPQVHLDWSRSEIALLRTLPTRRIVMATLKVRVFAKLPYKAESAGRVLVKVDLRGTSVIVIARHPL